jgi:hypothetical protein
MDLFHPARCRTFDYTKRFQYCLTLVYCNKSPRFVCIGNIGPTIFFSVHPQVIVKDLWNYDNTRFEFLA